MFGLDPQKSSPQKTSNPEDVRARLEYCFSEFPQFAGSIERRLKLDLFDRGEINAQEIEEQAKIDLNIHGTQGEDDPNLLDLGLWNQHLKARVREITLGHICARFSLPEVEVIIDQEVARLKHPPLQDVVWSHTVTFQSLRDCLDSKSVETTLPPEERMGTTVRIIRHTISDQEKFIEIAKHHLTFADFRDVLGRTMGNEHSMGKVGGKAAGIILARSILVPELKNAPQFLPLAFPETYYLRSDTIEDFINLNKFQDFRSKKYLSIQALRDQYPANRRTFVDGEFPEYAVIALKSLLEKIGNHPIIVRSSSLLEDRLGAAFSGKYESIFLGNQGPPEERLRELLRAIAAIYSGIWSPEVIAYRRQKSLIDYEEDMAIIIQKVVGSQVGKYFFPAFAGVAFGRNEFSWSPRIRREDGLVRMVMGLGTQAVDRIARGYPRMVPLGEPTLRHESKEAEIFSKSQRMIAVIDLEQNKYTTVPLDKILEENSNIPMLSKMISLYQDRSINELVGDYFEGKSIVNNSCLTFNRLLRETKFTEFTRWLLKTLEANYKIPVDVEFACDGERFYLLQCRSQAQSEEIGPVRIPSNITDANSLFSANRYIRTGALEDITHVVYVDPHAYNSIPTREKRIAVAQTVGRINSKLVPKSFVLIGPGRWGSNKVELGVPVGLADINRCGMLIEEARKREGEDFTPELSFGTHFFTDLVEAGILYLPLYPDDEEKGNIFNSKFFSDSPNILSSILPDDKEFADIIRVIHVPSVTGGKKLHIMMDGEAQKALGFFK